MNSYLVHISHTTAAAVAAAKEENSNPSFWFLIFHLAHTNARTHIQLVVTTISSRQSSREKISSRIEHIHSIELNFVEREKYKPRKYKPQKIREKKKEKEDNCTREERERKTLEKLSSVLMKSILVTFCSQNTIDHTLCIFNTCKQLFRTTTLFQCW